MAEFERFIIDNAEADIPRLLLSCKDWPERKDLAISTIEARKKLRRKVPEWYSCPSLVYPSALSAEQCSSSATARYKASVARSIAGGGKIADLTGGIGIDSWAFAELFGEVLYNERESSLADAARQNFRTLGVGNIKVSSVDVTPLSLGNVLDGFDPDLVFIDPARRSSDGRKVFLLEDCSPDVLKLLPGLLFRCRHLLLKLSPMADIAMAVERLDRAWEEYLEKTSGTGWNGNWVREVHVVSYGGECKELLVWMDREWNGPYSLICNEDGAIMTFSQDEVRKAVPSLPESDYAGFLFEPGKSLTKAGVFNALCGRFGLVKLGRSTHLYTSGAGMPSVQTLDNLRPFGKLFEVRKVLPMNKASFKEVRQSWPHSEVSARNIPLSSDELRSKLGVSSGEDAHIFGARVELPFAAGNYLFVCSRI